jgi:NAD-dependent deacetylase
VEPVAALAELVRRHARAVVLTGAGVSTESGIPDFRSRTGIWADVDPFEVASIDAFVRDPERVWDFYALRFETLLAAEPNAAHLALAELERRGRVRAVVTQNIDTLHARAGSSEVIEVHGSIRRAVCLRCPGSELLDGVRAQLRERRAPLCPACGAVLKPDVVLVVGSSLEVWPVAGLPLEAGSFAIVNRGPTALDDRAALVVDGGAGETLAALVEALG